MLASAGATAEHETELRDAGSLGGIRLAGTEDPNARKVYIVQLTAPSAAGYFASQMQASQKPGTQGRVRFDKTSPAIQSYAAQLIQTQDNVLARAGANAELIYRYQFGPRAW